MLFTKLLPNRRPHVAPSPAAAPEPPDQPILSEQLRDSLNQRGFSAVAEHFTSSQGGDGAADVGPSGAASDADRFLEAADQAQGFVHWQTYQTGGSFSPEAALKAGPVAVNGNQAWAPAAPAPVVVHGDYGTISAAAQATPESSYAAAINPYAVAASASQQLGSHDSLSETVAGQKGLFAASLGGNIGLAGMTASLAPSVGATVLHDSALKVVGYDSGTQRPLVRFEGKLTIIGDLSLAFVGPGVSAGVRLTLSGTREIASERYVDPATLHGALIRDQRWTRPLDQFKQALGGRTDLDMGDRQKIAQALLSEASQGSALATGESFEYLSAEGLTVGLSAGSMGVRGVATVHLQGSTQVKLARVDEDALTLEVTPHKLSGGTLSAEASLLGQLNLEGVISSSSRRRWRFDATSPEAMRALSLALSSNHYPGLTLEVTRRSRQSFDRHTTQQLEAFWLEPVLPQGVTLELASIVQHHEHGASAVAMRALTLLHMPAGFGRSAQRFEIRSAEATPEAMSVSHVKGRRSHQENLLAGALKGTFTAAIGKTRTGSDSFELVKLDLEASYNLVNSAGRQRQALAKLIAPGDAGARQEPQNAQRSTSYQVRKTWTLDLAALRALDDTPAERVREAAQQLGIKGGPEKDLLALFATRRTQVTSQPWLSLAEALSELVKKHGRKAIDLVTGLVPEAHMASQLSFDNVRLDRTVGRFMAIDTHSQQARSPSEVKILVEQLEHVERRLKGHQAELEGDNLMRALDDGSRQQKLETLAAMREHIQQSLAAARHQLEAQEPRTTAWTRAKGTFANLGRKLPSRRAQSAPAALASPTEDTPDPTPAL